MLVFPYYAPGMVQSSPGKAAVRKATQFLPHTANDLVKKFEIQVSSCVTSIINKSPDIVCSKANEYFSKRAKKKIKGLSC